VTSSNPHVFARVKTGNPHVKIHVHTNNDGSGSAYDGDMEFQLFRDFAPETASFIAGYAQSGYYDNVIFHRIIEDFVIQGGDPAGTGSGVTPGNVNLNLNYSLPHEFRKELIYSGRGQLAMANSADGYTGDNFPDNGNFRYKSASFTATNGTQFFITLGQPRHLDFKHTVFGQLVRGFDVIDKLESVPKTSDKPNVDVKMTALSVAPSKTDAILLLSATTPGPALITLTAKDPAGNTTSRSSMWR
jgi:peptidyl-prolyl cis-trans isomerase B (cyclophilin B)